MASINLLTQSRPRVRIHLLRIGPVISRGQMMYDRCPRKIVAPLPTTNESMIALNGLAGVAIPRRKEGRQ